MKRESVIFSVNMSEREAATLANALDMLAAREHFVGDQDEGNFASWLRMRILDALNKATA